MINSYSEMATVELLEDKKMSRNTRAQNTWSLTLLRNGEQGEIEEIEEAEFRFGRSSEELHKSTSLRISDGLVTLLRHSEIELEALETGFTVEMSMYEQPGYDWAPFSLAVSSCFSMRGNCFLISKK